MVGGARCSASTWRSPSPRSRKESPGCCRSVALVWLGLGGGLRALRRLVWAPGLLVFAVATALWLVPYLAKVGHDPASAAAVRDWTGALGTLHPSVLGLQALYGVLGFLPWTLVLPLALVTALRARQARPVAF